MSQELHTSRRKFIAGGIATATAASLSACDGGNAGSLAAPAGAAAAPLTQSELGEWERLVGGKFVVAGESGKIVATLAAIERRSDVSRPRELERHQPFIAFFETDLQRAPQGNRSYMVTHASRPAFDLFIGAVAEKRGKGVFLAVFN